MAVVWLGYLLADFVSMTAFGRLSPDLQVRMLALAVIVTVSIRLMQRLRRRAMIRRRLML